MAIFNGFFLVCQRVGWTRGWNGIPMDTIFSPQKNDRRAPGLRCCYDKSQQQYMSCAGNGGWPPCAKTYNDIYIYIRIPILYYVNYRYTPNSWVMLYTRILYQIVYFCSYQLMLYVIRFYDVTDCIICYYVILCVILSYNYTV